MRIESKVSVGNDDDDDDDGNDDNVLYLLTCTADKWVVMVFKNSDNNELQAFQKVLVENFYYMF